MRTGISDWDSSGPRPPTASSRLITGLLYDRTPNDPIAIVFAIIALTTVALIPIVFFSWTIDDGRSTIDDGRSTIDY
jgi:hypothetical protein